MSPAFLAVPKAEFLGLSSLVWIAAAVAIAAWIFLNYTAAGRALYAVGGNPVAARYCGIDLARQQLTVYTVSGAVSGLCGYLWVSRYGIAYSDIALGYELTVIAACVIGAFDRRRRRLGRWGAARRAVLGVIVNALPVINVSPFWQMAISGAVILAAVIVNSRPERRSGKLILPEARRKAASVSGGAAS